jgi:hypothetical protein
MSWFDKPMIMRTIPDQDRSCSECITRAITEEEKEKYSKIVPPKRDTTMIIPSMVRKTPPATRKLTKQQLLEECRNYGTDREGCEIIAKKYGYASYTSVSSKISQLKIREMLKEA